MDAPAPRQFGGVDDCVEAVLAKVGRRITLCTPIGAGKPVALVNAFYRRAAADPRIELSILTGLTLARPQPKIASSSGGWSSRSRQKIFGDAPEPDWIAPLRAGRLPANVRVQEFFMEPGAWLGVPLAQQSYASINYTHVARSVLAEGANVIAQQIALRPGGRASLGTNPDVTADLIPMMRERERAGTPVAIIGQVNDRMPFMFGDAEVPASTFDFIVDDARGYHDLIAPPNLPIPTADHAIALAASMLIRDGGTMQIGIGELGDAIVHAMTLRHRQNADWRRALADIGLLPRFEAEMRALGGDAPFDAGTLCRHRDVRGRIPRPVSRRNPEAARRAGRRAAAWRLPARAARVLRGAARHAGRRARALPDDAGQLHERAARAGLGGEDRPAARCALHQLRDDGDARRRARLGRARGWARRQRASAGSTTSSRRRTRCQAAARSSPCARRARAAAALESNIRWNYGHVTIPRHLRDVVLTEYGIADIRGKSDAEVAAAMLAIADSRFQPALARRSAARGQIAGVFTAFPTHSRANLPERLERALAPHRAAGRFGALPFGTDLSAEEIRLGGALRRLKARSETLGGKLAHRRGIAASIAARCRDPRVVRAHGSCRAARPARKTVSPSRRGRR